MIPSTPGSKDPGAPVVTDLRVVPDPDRVRGLLLDEKPTRLPEDVAYLFRKQMEEADVIVLNKADLLHPDEAGRLMSAVAQRFPGKEILTVSAKTGAGMDTWLDLLLSGRPAAGTVLSQIAMTVMPTRKRSWAV